MKFSPTEDKTSFVERAGESRLLNVSVRGWLAILLIGSVSFAYLLHVFAAVSVAITSGNLAALNNESLNLQTAMSERLALVALGYYFGKAEEHLMSRKKPTEVTT